MASSKRGQLAAKILESKEYAEGLRDANINAGLADQIRSLREARGWSQQELGLRALDAKGNPMRQERICQLEHPDYANYSLTTLKRLASAFDVDLVVRYAPFSDLADWLADLPDDRRTVPSRLKDSGLRQVATPVITTSSVAMETAKTSSTLGE